MQKTKREKGFVDKGQIIETTTETGTERERESGGGGGEN